MENKLKELKDVLKIIDVSIIDINNFKKRTNKNDLNKYLNTLKVRKDMVLAEIKDLEVVIND